MSGYHTMRICLNGHLITSMDDRRREECNFCNKCGAATTVACEHCGAQIRGDEIDTGGIVFIGFTPSIPRYCQGCGKPYPWTCRLLETASQLIRESDGSTPEEQAALIQSLPDLISVNPATPLAESRMKRFLTRASQVVANTMKEILVPIISEVVKKSLGF